jgi:GDP-L-fucose synthase
MPNNLYGPNDNYDLKTSHVLPALIRKFHEAKQKGIQSVEIWGTGMPKREFLYVDDLADACIFLMRNLEAIDLYESKISHLNVGSGEEISIKDLATTIKNIIGFDGELEFNTKFPDGMARKLLDVSRIKKLGWSSKTNLEVGLKKTYEWFINNYHNCI